MAQQKDDASYNPSKTRLSSKTLLGTVSMGDATTKAQWSPQRTTYDTQAPGSSYDPYAAAAAAQKAAQEKANKEAKERTQKENAATKAATEAEFSKLAGFETARDTKLGNIERDKDAADRLLIDSYSRQALGLEDTRKDNEKAEADETYSNILNTLRERGDLLSEVATQGAGETDALMAQLQALRNYQGNQQSINRSYHDTLTSINRALETLNTDTRQGRRKLYTDSEDAMEQAWANFYNQSADAWTNIHNIENQNTNIDSDSSEAYTKLYADASKKAADLVGQSYKKAEWDPALEEWQGLQNARKRDLTSSQARTVTTSGITKRPEGATLRRWE